MIRLGRVCTRPRARIHLALDGKTCGAARGASIGYETSRPDLAQPGNLCRRCFTPNRVAAAQQLLTSAHGIAAERIRIALAGVVQAMRTPDEAAKVDDLAARIRDDLLASGVLTPLGERMAATVALAPAVQALPEPVRRRTWATLRDEFATTHPQTTAA